MQITADISKILKSVLSGLTYIYDVLSELCIGFLSFLVILALENVVSFIETCFYRKRSSLIMLNYVETFHANIGYNLA